MTEPMTAAQLITLLEDCDPDTEIRIAHQPAWPLQCALAGIATDEDLDTPPDVEPDSGSADCLDGGDRPVLWLVAGDHPDGDTPYAPERLWQVARRG